VEIMPGVRSLDKAWILAINALALDLRKYETPVVTKNGYRELVGKYPGMAASYARVKTISVQMTPEGGPATSNEKYVVSQQPSDLQLKTYMEVFQRLYAQQNPDATFSLRKGTTSGPVRFEKEASAKLKSFKELGANLHLLTNLGRAAAANDAAAVDKALAEFTEARFSFAGKSGRRYQQDSAVWDGDDPKPKVRGATDWKGQYYEETKHTVDMFSIEFASSRSRLVYNEPGEINSMCQLAWSPFRDWSLRHHRMGLIELPAAEQEQMDDIYPAIASFDVKECDHAAPAWLLRAFCHAMCTVGFPSSLAWATMFLHFGPMVVTNDHLFGKGGVLVGELAKGETYGLCAGNRSGFFGNADFNKAGVNTDVGIRLAQAGFCPMDPRSIGEFVEQTLTGAHPGLFMQNRGDNVKIQARSAQDLSRATSAIMAEPKGGVHIYRYAQDPFVQFDGWDYCSAGNTRRREPNKENALAKITLPEFTWTASAAPASGMEERVRRLSTATGGVTILELVEKTHRRTHQ